MARSSTSFNSRTAKKSGRKGGRENIRRHGSERMEKIASIGGITCRTRYGHGFFSHIRASKKKS